MMNSKQDNVNEFWKLWFQVLFEYMLFCKRVRSEFGDISVAPYAGCMKCLVNMYEHPVWVHHAFSAEPPHEHLSPQMWEDNYKYSSAEKQRGLEEPVTCRVLLQGSQDVVLICPFPLRGQALVWDCHRCTSHHWQFQTTQEPFSYHIQSKESVGLKKQKQKKLHSKVLSEVQSERQANFKVCHNCSICLEN